MSISFSNRDANKRFVEEENENNTILNDSKQMRLKWQETAEIHGRIHGKFSSPLVKKRIFRQRFDEISTAQSKEPGVMGIGGMRKKPVPYDFPRLEDFHPARTEPSVRHI